MSSLLILHQAATKRLPLDLGIEQDQVFLILYGTGIRGVSAGGVSVTIGGEAVCSSVCRPARRLRRGWTKSISAHCHAV